MTNQTVVEQPDYSGKSDAKLAKQTKKRCFIVAAIAVLLIVLSAILLAGVWYLASDANCRDVISSESVEDVDQINVLDKKEFFLGIPRYENYNISMVQNHIQIDERNGFEYILMKDPKKKHTMFIVIIDRNWGLTYIYGSEHGQCMIFLDTACRLEESLQIVREYNGQDIERPTARYTYRETGSSVNLNSLPPTMQMLCTPEKTTMMERATRGDWDVSAQVYHVCVCYHYCWCSFCEDINCWGQCAPARVTF